MKTPGTGLYPFVPSGPDFALALEFFAALYPWARELQFLDPGGVCWHVRQARTLSPATHAAAPETGATTGFPAFTKAPANRIARASQFTDDVEGYVFDGADGSQVALWTAHADRVSSEHAHDFEEYVLVIEGRATLVIGERRVELPAGQEFVIPKGTRQSMEVTAGTRTMHVFGGKRARREGAKWSACS